MATFNTDQAAIQQNSHTNLATRAEGGTVNGTPGVLHATYLKTSTEVANDLIRVGHLPRGARFIPHLSRVAFEAGDDTATGKFIYINEAGTQVDLTPSFTTTVIQAGSVPGFPMDVEPDATGETIIYWKHGSYGGTPADGQKLQFAVGYTIRH